jgi:hypothetical protein
LVLFQQAIARAATLQLHIIPSRQLQLTSSVSVSVAVAVAVSMAGVGVHRNLR